MNKFVLNCENKSQLDEHFLCKRKCHLIGIYFRGIFTNIITLWYRHSFRLSVLISSGNCECWPNLVNLFHPTALMEYLSLNGETELLNYINILSLHLEMLI
jgi:hypothetical protein